MCAICVVWNRQRLTKAELERAYKEVSIDTDYDPHLYEVGVTILNLPDTDEPVPPPKISS